MVRIINVGEVVEKLREPYSKLCSAEFTRVGRDVVARVDGLDLQGMFEFISTIKGLVLNMHDGDRWTIAFSTVELRKHSIMCSLETSSHGDGKQYSYAQNMSMLVICDSQEQAIWD